MLKIRLQRIGKKGQAYFRLVVTEHTTRPKGKYLELLGAYDPHKNVFDAKADRVKHWMSQGAQLSPTANNLLVGRKIIEGEKVQVWKAPKSDKPQATPVQSEDGVAGQASDNKETTEISQESAPESLIEPVSTEAAEERPAI